MTPESALDPRALESLLAFWRDAGVAEMLDPQPHDRTLEAAARLKAKAPAPDAAAPAVMLPAAGPDVAEGAARAREAALACDTLEALTAAVAAFEGSGLKRARPPAVFRGPADARLMVVGEAPGAEDEQAGRVFAGAAGALLDRALSAAGLLDRALLTHTVFWRPPGDRAPTADEQTVLAPFLDRAIGLVRPQALLVLGGGPARALLRQEGGVMSLRGRWFERVSDDGALSTPALVSLTPGFLLMQPAGKKLFWADLLAMAARLETDTVNGA